MSRKTNYYYIKEILDSYFQKKKEKSEGYSFCSNVEKTKRNLRRKGVRERRGSRNRSVPISALAAGFLNVCVGRVEY